MAEKKGEKKFKHFFLSTSVGVGFQWDAGGSGTGAEPEFLVKGDEFFFFFRRQTCINTKAYKYLKSLYICVCTY
jgi:hypothetical protein